MNKKDLVFLSTVDLSNLIKNKTVSPVEATEAYLNRIQEIDPKLNSFITVCAEEALEQSKQAETEIQNGHHRSPMHGIPIAVKDQIYTKGIRTTNGSNVHRNFVPDFDATVISNLKRSGSILLGKLNMSEFASGDAFYHPYGRPLNPWDLSRNPGTSSSGSGAATAAFLCSTSLGEDTAGSIRGPAAFCGLVGIRPTWGLVSRYGVFGACWSMDTVGPISRSTADCAITLSSIAGYDHNDPFTRNTAVPDYLSYLTGDIKGVKIGIIEERIKNDVVDPEVRDATNDAISVLESLGATIINISLPLLVHSAVISSTIIASDAASLNTEHINNNLEKFDYNNQIRMLMGSILPGAAYQKAIKLREILREQIIDALKQVDVLLMPTSSIPSTLIPNKAGLTSKEEVVSSFSGRRNFTAPFNLASNPAISVNCGFTNNGLPIGLQIAGKPFDEVTVLKVAHAFEASTEWHNRKPPI